VRDRPLCAELSAARDEDVGATASRVENWLLVEYGGYWPYDPLDAAVFAGSLRDELAATLASLPNARLLLVKRSGGARRDRVEVIYGATPERGAWFRRLELDHHGQLAELQPAPDGPGEPLEHPLLLVCTHGIRDRCCARYGQALCRAIDRLADPAWIRQCSHVGGDRFAGNLVVLPEGLYFGRVGATEAAPLLAAYLEGRIDLDRYRGRSCWPFAAQAAELAVRRQRGLTGFHDLRVESVRRTAPERWEVAVLAEVAGDTIRVEVVREHGEPTLLTCRAKEPRRPRRFVALG
jgi:hypothetical protein